MTISSGVRKAGPYEGNDVTTAFPFSFKVFSAADVVVVLTDPAGVETTLTVADYSVALNADQDTAPGGTVNKHSALATDYLLTITSSVQNLQPLDLTNQGGFYPKVINNALDRLTILVQQVAEQVSRAVKVGISSALSPEQFVTWLYSASSTATAKAEEASNSAAAAAASLAALTQFSGSVVGGDLSFTGQSARIKGDFSNATVSYRAMVQSSVTNGNTNFGLLPNGSATVSAYQAYNGADPANASYAQLSVSSSAVDIASGIAGTGALLPITFSTAGAERMRIDAATGAVGIGGTVPSATWASVQGVLELGSNTAVFTTSAGANSLASNLIFDGAVKYRTTGVASRIAQSGGSVFITSYPSANAGDAAAGIATFRVSTDGNSLHVTPNGGLGYGPGAGGTVTQPTSKSTAVTLNKPCGQITMNNAALAAGATAPFVFNNSLIGADDALVVEIAGGYAASTSYTVRSVGGTAGFRGILLKNESASPLAEAVVIRFVLLKGATF